MEAHWGVKQHFAPWPQLFSLFPTRTFAQSQTHLWTRSCRRSAELLPLWSCCRDSRLAASPPETAGKGFGLVPGTSVLSLRPLCASPLRWTWRCPYLTSGFQKLFWRQRIEWVHCSPGFKWEWTRGKGERTQSQPITRWYAHSTLSRIMEVLLLSTFVSHPSYICQEIKDLLFDDHNGGCIYTCIFYFIIS